MGEQCLLLGGFHPSAKTWRRKLRFVEPMAVTMATSSTLWGVSVINERSIYSLSIG